MSKPLLTAARFEKSVQKIYGNHAAFKKVFTKNELSMSNMKIKEVGEKLPKVAVFHMRDGKFSTSSARINNFSIKIILWNLYDSQ